MLKVKSEFNMNQSLFFFLFLALMSPVVSPQALKRAVHFATEICCGLPKPGLQIYFAPLCS